MDQLRTLVINIGLDELLNCILVQNDVRPAMLIQPADYEEATYKDPKTAAKLLAIKRQFPDLIQSVVDGGEVFIAKHAIKPEDIKENATMGKILGYPCYADYQYTLDNKDAIKVGIDIHVELKPGFDKDSVQILGYMCRDERFFNESQAFAKRCEKVLKADPIVGKVIVSVVAEKDIIMPVKYLINKLARNEGLSQSEEDAIINHLWNLGFPEELGREITSINYQYKNPVHRGMLISLLTLADNNQMEPFWPLQYRKEQAAVDKISAAWARELIRLFRETESASGSGRKTRKQ
jgi:hypothetical protein